MADQVINDIKDRLNLTEVIGGYIELKKSGANYKAVCPFHGERTASLMVSPQKQIWHCFGCGEGGDVFGFVMRYENLDFRETLELLADRAGVQLPVYQPKQADITDDLLRVNSFAAEVYHRFLNTQPGAETARQYLKGRGLSEQTIELWRIGFAPNQFDFLQKLLAEKKISFERMQAAGVASKSERGQTFDRFRNRITFPIFNYRGDVVGFSARILPGGETDAAKYVNSPETPIYNKSKVMFGLNFAKEAIRKANEVVIVEGQMDVIQAHQAGFTNTVATSGTALTEDHLRLLSRLTKQLKFCFDADSAGLAATQRAGKLALQMGFAVKIIMLERGEGKAKDPDDLIRTSPGMWQKAVKEAVWFVDFYLNQAAGNFESGSLEQKQYLNELVIPLIYYISNPVEQDHYVKKLSEKFGISERVVRDAASKPQQGDSPKTGPATPAAIPANPQLLTEKQILGGILTFPEFLGTMRTEGLPAEAFGEDLRPLVAQVLAGEMTYENATDTLAKEAIFMVESGLDEVANDRNVYLRDLEKSANLIKLTHLKRQLQDLTVHINKAQSSGDANLLNDLNRQFAALTNQRIQLENQL